MIKVKLNHPNAKLPVRSFPTDAGADLFAAENMLIPAGGRASVSTGINIQFTPDTNNHLDFYFRIAPRSGLAYKNGLDVLAGVVDRSYVGDVMVVMLNTSDEDYYINTGDKVAQLIQEVCIIDRFVEVDSLDATDRGTAGFGSTGM